MLRVIMPRLSRSYMTMASAFRAASSSVSTMTMRVFSSDGGMGGQVKMDLPRYAVVTPFRTRVCFRR